MQVPVMVAEDDWMLVAFSINRLGLTDLAQA